MLKSTEPRVTSLSVRLKLLELCEQFEPEQFAALWRGVHTYFENEVGAEGSHLPVVKIARGALDAFAAYNAGQTAEFRRIILRAARGGTHLCMRVEPVVRDRGVLICATCGNGF